MGGLYEILKMIDARFGRGVGSVVLALVLLAISAASAHAVFSYAISPLANATAQFLVAQKLAQPTLLPRQSILVMMINVGGYLLAIAALFAAAKLINRSSKRLIIDSDRVHRETMSKLETANIHLAAASETSLRAVLELNAAAGKLAKEVEDAKETLRELRNAAQGDNGPSQNK